MICQTCREPHAKRAAAKHAAESPVHRVALKRARFVSRGFLCLNRNYAGMLRRAGVDPWEDESHVRILVRFELSTAKREPGERRRGPEKLRRVLSYDVREGLYVPDWVARTLLLTWMTGTRRVLLVKLGREVCESVLGCVALVQSATKMRVVYTDSAREAVEVFLASLFKSIPPEDLERARRKT